MNSVLWRVCEGLVIEGKYHLQRLLGTGSYGGVFLADEVVADRLIRQVAVKLIEPDPRRSDRQMQELIAATNLDHPFLLRCFTPGICELNNLPLLYLVTELAEETLQHRLEGGPLPLPEAYDTLHRIASALAYLHEQPRPLVHRDIKPANVMSIGGRWKLGDFGLLRAVDSAQGTRTGTIVGTAAYAPPESYEGIVSPAWDVWSLGALMQETLTGCLPFSAETPHQLMIAVSSQEPALPADLPAPYVEIIRGCLTKDPGARWTAAQVLEALEAAVPPSRPIRAGTGALSPDFYQRLSPPSSSHAKRSLIVSPSGEGDYRTLGEAIRSVPPNTVIRVRPGLYNETLVIDRPVEIAGDGPAESIVIETTGCESLIVDAERATLRGLTLQSRAGIHQRKHHAVVIRRGEILLEECDIACTSLACVSVQGAAATPTLRNCHIHDGKTGGILFGEGSGGRVEACELFANFGPGIHITGGAGPTLSDCRIHDGREAGLQIDARGAGRIDYCHLYDNEGPGIHIGAEAAPAIHHCTIYANRQAGIAVRGQCQATLTDCDIHTNVLSGVTVAQGANPLLQRCHVHDGLSNGIWVSEHGQGSIEDCEIVGNAFAGIKVSQGGNPVIRRTTLHDGKRNAVTIQDRGRATMVDCDIFANAQTGVVVEPGGHLTIRRCILRDGKEGGLWFAGDGVMEECEVFNNAKAGVEVTAGGCPALRICRLHHGQFPGLLVHAGGQATAEECDLFANALPNVAIGEDSKALLTHCKIYDGKQVGVVFWDRGRGIMEECDVYGNALGGVRILQASDPQIRHCRINRNGQQGVQVSGLGEGSIVQCDLSDNAGGPIYVESGSRTQCRHNTPA